MTREEAIEVVKKNWPDSRYTSLREALETLIPELVESEDDRIVRCIEVALTDVDEQRFKDFGTTLKDCIAYLEKQKEIPMPNSTELIDMWDKEKTKLEEKDFRDDAWRLAYNAFMDGFARGTCVKFEKQNEQKPTEWSEEDEDYMKDLMDYFGHNLPLEHTPHAVRDWLKSLRPSWKPSKEQIYSLGTVVKGMGYISEGSTGYHLKELYEQLKKLI